MIFSKCRIGFFNCAFSHCYLYTLSLWHMAHFATWFLLFTFLAVHFTFLPVDVATLTVGICWFFLSPCWGSLAGCSCSTSVISSPGPLQHQRNHKIQLFLSILCPSVAEPSWSFCLLRPLWVLLPSGVFGTFLKWIFDHGASSNLPFCLFSFACHSLLDQPVMPGLLPPPCSVLPSRMKQLLLFALQ